MGLPVGLACLGTSCPLYEVRLPRQGCCADQGYSGMYDLYLDILFMRARQRELAQEVANQALLRQAHRATRRRSTHILLTIRDRLRILGLWFGARRAPPSRPRDGIPACVSDTLHGVAPKNSAPTQGSRVKESEGCGEQGRPQ
jgi:hypothetical protein